MCFPPLIKWPLKDTQKLHQEVQQFLKLKNNSIPQLSSQILINPCVSSDHNSCVCIEQERCESRSFRTGVFGWWVCLVLVLLQAPTFHDAQTTATLNQPSVMAAPASVGVWTNTATRSLAPENKETPTAVGRRWGLGEKHNAALKGPSASMLLVFPHYLFRITSVGLCRCPRFSDHLGNAQHLAMLPQTVWLLYFSQHLHWVCCSHVLDETSGSCKSSRKIHQTCQLCSVVRFLIRFIRSDFIFVLRIRTGGEVNAVYIMTGIVG